MKINDHAGDGGGLVGGSGRRRAAGTRDAGLGLDLARFRFTHFLRHLRPERDDDRMGVRCHRANQRGRDRRLDSNSGGPFSSEAGLYTASGTLLESALISTATSTPVASASTGGQWLFETFAPITLPVGEHVIGNVAGNDLPLAEIGATFVTIPQITLLGGTEGTNNGGLSAPTSPFAEPIFGPTLQLTSVPEPSTWAMTLLGLMGLGYAGYRQRHKLGGTGSV
jgi:hypothetical protein